MAIGRQDYEERKESKIDALTEKARKSTELANQEFSRAGDMGSVIPLGQPILVGHHSEKSHRGLLKRIDAAYRNASEAGDKAAYYQGKADTAATNQSISGDDTEAVNRYKQKLEQLETAQERMKAINKAWKQGNNALYKLGLTDIEIEKLKSKMPSYEKKPFPTWALSNNSAEIRRVKDKLEEFNKLDQMEAEKNTFPGGELFINIGINRVQFLFDDIPSMEIRKLLKSHGFKWAPSEKAWQRQRTINAVNAANYLVKKYFID
ncbi:MAG: DUF3560 domain-containing protein [Treponema sp.]|jgi:hypothetical protein|nr:DUF3560 domain-containing protein [Treponema sp.]